MQGRELVAFGLMRDTNHNCSYSMDKKWKQLAECKSYRVFQINLTQSILPSQSDPVNLTQFIWPSKYDPILNQYDHINMNQSIWPSQSIIWFLVKLVKVGQPFSFQYLLYKYFSLLYANPLKVFVYLCHSCTSDKLSFSFLQFACDRQSGQMVCKQLPLVTTLIKTFVNLRKIPFPNS